MHGLIVLLLISSAAATDGYSLVNPRAIELFEHEPQLMDWALARFDSDGDGYLSIFEADKAAAEFKAIADGDKDGQVTPAEFRAGREFVVARWVAGTAQVSKR